MPRISKELSALAVKRLSQGVHAVGGVSGLLLQVQQSGARSWLLRYSINGRRREMGLGPYPEVSLAQARAKAAELRSQIRAGRDPIDERQQARKAAADAARTGKTFSEVLAEYAAEKFSELGSEKYRSQWRATVRNYAEPVLGDMLLRDITLDDVLKVLKPIWLEKTETASKLQGRLEKLMAFGAVKGYRTPENPAQWKNNLAMVLPSPSKVSQRENYPALQLRDCPRWWRALLERDGIGSLALQFQAMTVSRTGLVRFATWDEIDLDQRLWTIQPARKGSKIKPKLQGGRPHRVPLTPEMVALLERVPRFQGSSYIFPGEKDGMPMSDATAGKLMDVLHEADIKGGRRGYLDRDTGKRAVPHGFRSCFRTWVSDYTDFDGDMAEIALAHTVGTKVQQAYDRAAMVEKRREMMKSWVRVLQGAEV
ncbi:tyrosine-type recombinase/integrase [Leisingera caerulea]|uniref:Integrase arm-type DNA-binding domain-containing protein n=1 Tax=Leisingera caerulea TaxID=506591 RepID=A0A9Q9HJ90_LEICA|nr:site-specific integrase [Leisingera caerulea]UWQ54992.1 integrase arm-type DNA-binding domain-containing protein [Leisingera caerulea]